MQSGFVITEKVVYDCRWLVFCAARRHKIAPVLITSHTRTTKAVRARTEVWRAMIVDMRIPRGKVAVMFDRDLRRMRRSVLGF